MSPLPSLKSREKVQENEVTLQTGPANQVNEGTSELVHKRLDTKAMNIIGMSDIYVYCTFLT